jgi:predicted nucleic acid-binding protein
MIAFFDTSALLKFYLEEPGHAEVRLLRQEAEAVAVSVLAYPEMTSALYRNYQEKGISKEVFKKCLMLFHRDWNSFHRIHLEDALARKAGQYVRKYKLRGADAVHLASALFLCERMGSSISFCCFDRVLLEASKKTKRFARWVP